MTAGVVDASELAPSVWRRLYDEILVQAFPPEQLIAMNTFVESVRSGGSRVWMSTRGATPDGVAVVDRHATCDAESLAYLAVVSHHRRRGTGSRLLHEVVEASDAGLLFVEVEDPAHHRDRGYGDPRRRAAFYAKHGAAVIDVPFFQPPLRSGLPPVPDVLLAVLGPAARATSVDGKRVRCFVTDYFDSVQHTADGALERALWESLQRDRLPLVGLGDYVAQAL